MMEKELPIAACTNKKEWMTPQLEVLNMKHTYADDGHWEFNEFDGFWKRNYVSTSLES